MNHSFIVRSGSIIGLNMSGLEGQNNNISIELTPRDKSVSRVSRDISFFKLGFPEIDMVNEVDVLKSVPIGRF